LRGIAALRKPPAQITVHAYEIDPPLAKVLRVVLNKAKRRLGERGITLEVKVIERDFILENAG
jgi:hypothetical protein